MNANLEIAQAVYAAFAAGDIPGVLGRLAPDVRWTEAVGGPYGGLSIGPQAVLDNVFMKIGGEWEGFAAVPHRYVCEGDTVVALGEYSATFRATGKSFRSPFAHVWRFQDGVAVEFTQHVDTVLHRQPMQ